MWRGSVPPNFLKAPKKWSCPVSVSEGTKPRMEKESIQLVVKSLVLERFPGWNVAGLAERLALALRP